MKDIATIERYLNGEMTEEETRLFEAEMATNQELKQEVLLRQSIIKTTQQIGSNRDEALLAAMQKTSAQDFETFIKPPIKKKTNNKRLYIALASSAAVIALIIVFTLFQSYQTDIDIYNRYYTDHQTNNTNYRGIYEDDTFQIALYLWREEYKEGAIIRLENIVSQGDEHPYYQDACWYLSLFYINQHKTRPARKLLQQIVAEQGYYTKQAAEIMELLD